MTFSQREVRLLQTRRQLPFLAGMHIANPNIHIHTKIPWHTTTIPTMLTFTHAVPRTGFATHRKGCEDVRIRAASPVVEWISFLKYNARRQRPAARVVQWTTGCLTVDHCLKLRETAGHCFWKVQSTTAGGSRQDRLKMFGGTF